MRQLEYKNLVIKEIKTSEQTPGMMTITGYLVVFGNEDLGDDVIERGACKTTLLDWEKKQMARGAKYLFPFLWDHDDKTPIGGFTVAQEDTKGVYVEIEIDCDIQRGKETASGYNKGYLSGLSVGYVTKRRHYVGGTRHLDEIQIWEGSGVTLPMNEEALVMSIKTASGKTSWPLGYQKAAWSNADATKRIETWADGDAAKLASVHFWKDPSADATTIGAYKLLFCDVVGGAVKAMPKGIQACAGAIQGARSPLKIPSGDMGGVKSRVASYYKKMAKAFDDDSIVVPWSAQKAIDFTTAYQTAQTDLQEQWHDANLALIQAIVSIMQDDGESDKPGAIQTCIDQFSDVVADLAQRSQDADFCPEMDWDNDSFADSTGADLDDDSGPRWSLWSRGAAPEGKAGRVMSQANHAAMGKSLAKAQAGITELKTLHKSMAPNLTQPGDPADEGEADQAIGVDESTKAMAAWIALQKKGA